MINKQNRLKKTTTTKGSKTKQLLMTICVCGGLLLGAGGTIAATNSGFDHGSSVSAASKKQAKTADIKIDQNAAIDKFNSKYQNKQITEIKLEDDHGKYVYEVKGFDDTKEYEVKVNAKTGKVIASESERRDQNEPEYQLDSSTTISRDEASKIAETAAKKGHSREWELKQEKDKAVWEVTVVNGHQAKEVTINANSKEVLSTKNDNDY